MHKIYSLLGLCMKAGKLSAGEVGCEMAVRSKTALLMLIAGNASENTKKKFKDSGRFYNVPVYIFGTKEELGTSLGKDTRSVAVITEQGFAEQLENLLEQSGYLKEK